MLRHPAIARQMPTVRRCCFAATILVAVSCTALVCATPRLAEASLTTPAAQAIHAPMREEHRQEDERRAKAEAERLRLEREAALKVQEERLKLEHEAALKAQAKAQSALASPERACKRNDERLARLRASRVRDEVFKFERELACERLRPQVLRLRESVDSD
jgi:hypothetical protein